MNKLKIWLIVVLSFFLLPNVVNAASGKISVTGSSTAVVGNKVTVTVTLSSSVKIGSWQMELNYDKAKLKLLSSTTEAGGIRMAASSAGGVKSKSYTFTFKTLKSGSTKVSVSSYLAYDYEDMEELNISTSSKTIKVMTQEELEATYSANANLSNIKVGNYDLNPKFSKKVFEYNVEVENEVNSVKVEATKEDSKSSIEGTGVIELLEGNNKVEITVTSQKGNSLTYVVNIYRKELDPITVDINDKTYTVIRKKDAMPNYATFNESTVTYDDTEIPALYSETTGYTLIALKDEEGNIYTYIYDVTIKDRYEEVNSNSSSVYPLKLPNNKDYQNYVKKKIEFNGYKIDAYMLTEDSNTAIIYAQDVETGDIRYYDYDLEDRTIQKHDKELSKYYEKIIENYKYVLIGFIVFTILLLFIIIVRSGKKTPKVKPQEI